MSVQTFTKDGPFDYKTVDPNDFSTHIYTLFLSASSLVIKERRKVQAPNGGHYYKEISCNFYKVYVNKHGEKYLRALRKTGTGRFFVTSTGELMRDDFLYDRGFSTNPCPEMIQTIETHLTKILGFRFTYSRHSTEGENYKNSPEYLCYPFYRDEKNKVLAKQLTEDIRLSQTSNNQKFSLGRSGARGLLTALRHSANEAELIKSLVYKSAVRTDEDVQLLKTTPYLLRLLSCVDLKMPATEALAKGYAEVIYNYSDYMTSVEFLAFKFLLHNLPKKSVKEVQDLLLHLAEFRAKQATTYPIKEVIRTHDRYVNGLSCNGHFHFISSGLRNIPLKDRRSFAQLFWKEFSSDYSNTEDDIIKRQCQGNPEESKNKNKKIDQRYYFAGHFIKTMDCYIRSYSEKYLKNESEDSIERCISLAKELFGEDISQDKNLSWKTVSSESLGNSWSYFDFQKYMVNQHRPSKERSLIHSILKSADFSSSTIHSFSVSPVNHVVTGHTQEGSSGQSYNKLLPMELEKLLRRVASLIDAELIRLGQKVTPENRMMCLAANKEQRKYKINWKYFQLGVEPDEVYMYKKGGIKLKKDIEFWVETKKTLPADTYKELLNDLVFGATTKERDLDFFRAVF